MTELANFQGHYECDDSVRCDAGEHFVNSSLLEQMVLSLTFIIGYLYI